MRSVRFRKDTIFRLYLGAFCLLFSAACFFLVSSQSRFHRREIAGLRVQVSQLSAELSERKSVSSGPVDSDPQFSVSSQSQNPQDLFWIEGTGTNRRWWYMDVVFLDGSRSRYFVHLPLRRSDLVNLHRRLSHDSLSHYWEPGWDDEET